MAESKVVAAVPNCTAALRLHIVVGLTAGAIGVGFSDRPPQTLLELAIAVVVMAALYVVLDRRTMIFQRLVPRVVAFSQLPPVADRRSTLLINVLLLTPVCVIGLVVCLATHPNEGGVLGVVLGTAATTWRVRRHLIDLEAQYQATAYGKRLSAGGRQTVWLVPTADKATTAPA